tara:strand:+ start:2935 stop:4053 length:1119 start_codon:yes stop_codon:yes gene_type:complete
MSYNKNKKIFYISDFSLPNMSAYTIHVLKMCDAFSESYYDVSLLLPHIRKGYKLKKIQTDYLLKNSFKILGFFESKIKRGLPALLLFSYKLFSLLKKYKKPHLIISRSIIPALFLSIFGKKLVLEIHTEMKGVTKFLFSILRYFHFFNRIKFILINKNLNKKLKLRNRDFIVLDDCVDCRDFKHNKKKMNSCVYTGSFVKGKGIETIISIASKLPEVNFILYGNIKTLSENLYKNIVKQKNIILNDFIPYNRITKILPKNKILLMPYEKKVGVLINNLDVSDYISPLKLFDYLASGSIIIASRKKAYSHILKHNFNCFLTQSNNIQEWVKTVEKVLSIPPYTQRIQKNSIQTALKYSWLKRVEKIIKFKKRI